MSCLSSLSHSRKLEGGGNFLSLSLYMVSIISLYTSIGKNLDPYPHLAARLRKIEKPKDDGESWQSLHVDGQTLSMITLDPVSGCRA